MGAVGLWRIPRIRTGLTPKNRPLAITEGRTPSNSSAQTSLRLHNLPLFAVEEIPGTDGKTDKTRTIETFENLSNWSTGQVRGENKKNLEATTRDTSTNWLASWWTQEAACLRQRHGMPGFRSCELLRVVCFTA